MPKLAVIILTKNEENNIVDCIRSVDFADEIIVIDSGSVDKTKQLAEDLNANFVYHAMTEGFAGQRNFALTQTDAEWVFYLDADERVTPATADKIREIVNRDEKVVYSIRRENIVFGQRMYYGAHRPDYAVRMAPRKAICWTGKVHEGIQTNYPICKMTGYLEHYTYVTWQQYFAKFNQYTTLAAEEMYTANKKITQLEVLGHTIGAFIRNYILNKGFLDGFMGLVMSLTATMYTMIKYLKLRNLYMLAQDNEE